MAKSVAPSVLVIVSDTHCGGATALCPPRFDESRDTPDGRECRAFLWEAWKRFANHWLPGRLGGRPYTLVVNGDCIEGLHHDRAQILTTSLPRQWRMFRDTLAVLPPRHTLYVVEGTRVHVLDDEAEIAEEMGATPDPHGRYAWKRLSLVLGGKAVSIRHHIGTTGRPWLEANQLGMTLAAERLAAVNAGERPTDILVAAHRHIGGYARTDSGLAICTPSWQFPTRFVFKINPSARMVCGATLLDFDDPDGSGFPRVWEFRQSPGGGNRAA